MDDDSDFTTAGQFDLLPGVDLYLWLRLLLLALAVVAVGAALTLV